MPIRLTPTATTCSVLGRAEGVPRHLARLPAHVSGRGGLRPLPGGIALAGGLHSTASWASLPAWQGRRTARSTTGSGPTPTCRRRGRQPDRHEINYRRIAAGHVG